MRENGASSGHGGIGWNKRTGRRAHGSDAGHRSEVIRSFASCVAFGATLLAFAPDANAEFVRGQTYCVGGFEFILGFPTRQDCAPHDSPWHFHTYVQGPDGKCRECWDRQDATCESVFIPSYAGFSAIDPYECRRAGALPPGEVISVEDGRPKKAPPPPPVLPLDVNAEIVRVSPGPYSVGDTVRIDARAVGPDGKPRAVQGGEIVVRGSDGSEKLRIPVRPNADGTVSADVKIPAGGNVKLEFDPKGIALTSSEKLGSVKAGEASLVVSPCRLRGAVLSPTGGEVVVGGASLLLTGQLRTAAGVPAPSSALSSGASAIFAIDVGGKSLEVPAALDAAGAATATVTIDAPPSDDAAPVTIRLFGRGGADDLCPGDPAVSQVTKLGVGVEVVEPTEGSVCYVGRNCRIAVRLKRPSGVASAVGETFVRAPDLRVSASVHGDPPRVLASDGGRDPLYAVTFVPKIAGPTDLMVIAAAAGKEARGQRRFRIRQPLELKLPAELDLGSVEAGSPRNKTCRDLDFSASRGVDEQNFEVTFAAPAACRSTVGWLDSYGLFRTLVKQEIGFNDPRNLKMPICLEVPRCAGEHPEPAMLTVRATSLDFPNERATVKIRWRVEGRNFLACDGWWVGALGAILFALFVAYGWVRPDRFSGDDMVQIAKKREGLARATGRRLKELPGGRPGWYRSSRTGLREDGSPTDQLRGATIVFMARRGEVMLHCNGGLRRMNQQTKKLEDLTVGKEGYAASKNVIYCAGSLFFQVK